MFLSEHAEQLVYGLLLLLIFSILTNLYFINSGLQRKISKRAFNKEFPQHLKKFLLGQAQKTEDARRHNERKHLSKGVISLRNAYLKIEAKAINQTIDSKAYWNLINSNVQKLLDILVEQKKSRPLLAIEEKIAKIREKIALSPPSKSTKNVLESLEKFHSACVSNSNNPAKIAHYSEKLEQLLSKLDSAAYRKLTEKAHIHDTYSQSSNKTIEDFKGHIEQSNASLKNLSDINPDDYDFSLQAFNKNNTDIIESVDKFERNIERINNSNRNTKTAIITSSNNEIKNANSELDELSEQIQQENEEEIERLRQIIKGQKNIIVELEDSISTIEETQPTTTPSNITEGRTTPQQDKNTDIKQLKLSLRDAEFCIDTLEKELETLKTNHQHHKEHPKDEPVTEPLSNTHLASLENTISQLKGEISEAHDIHDLNTSIMNFISECLDASSVEDISLSIYQTLGDLGWSSGLFISGGARTLEIDPSGLLKDREKMLIKNMQIDEVDSQNAGKTIRFHYMHISGKLVTVDPQSSTNEKHGAILNLLKTTDKIIGRMKSDQNYKKQRKVIQESSNNIKKIAHEVDQTIDTINKRTKDSVSNGFGQIQDIARSKGLKASQIASFKNLEQQTLNEIAADNSLRLKVKKQFLVILKNLEDGE